MSQDQNFFKPVFQIFFMTEHLVRTICKQIEELKLKSISGENVAKLGQNIISKVKQIECSGYNQIDLKVERGCLHLHG